MNSHPIDIIDFYFKAFNKFEHELNGGIAHPFHHVRRNALSRIKELGFPSLRNEDWKYTNISPILNQSYQFPAKLPKMNKSEILSLILPTLKDNTLVFLNGHFIESLSLRNLSQDKGFRLMNKTTPYRPAFQRGSFPVGLVRGTRRNSSSQNTIYPTNLAV